MDNLNTPTPEEFDPIITLTDADGNDVEYEFLDVVEYSGHEYAVVMPTADDDGLVVILRIEPVEDDPEQEAYIGVDDEEEAEAVFQLFKEQNADEFDFTD